LRAIEIEAIAAPDALPIKIVGRKCEDNLMPGFHEGQKVWVEGPNGQRPAVFVVEAEASTFFGGAPQVYVVFTDTREGAEVEIDRVIARHE